VIIKNSIAFIIALVSLLIVIIEFYIINNILHINYKQVNFKLPKTLFSFAIKVYVLNTKNEKIIRDKIKSILNI
jgi:hypothetical protein